MSPIIWGRCRRGTRWHWVAARHDDEITTLSGDAPTEKDAVEAAHDAVRELGGTPATAHVRHGLARNHLRKVNADERAARGGSTSQDVDRSGWLYGTSCDENGARHVVAYRITRWTAKRVYYVRRDPAFPGDTPEIGFVDRQALERDGKVSSSRGWWDPTTVLYAAPPNLEVDRPAAPDLRALRRAMGDAHPDRGGTAEQFQEARRRYQRALAAGRVIYRDELYWATRPQAET